MVTRRAALCSRNDRLVKASGVVMKKAVNGHPSRGPVVRTNDDLVVVEMGISHAEQKRRSRLCFSPSGYGSHDFDRHPEPNLFCWGADVCVRTSTLTHCLKNKWFQRW